MFVIKRAAPSPKGTVVQLLLKENYSQVLSPVSLNVITKKTDTETFLQKTGFQEHLKRPLHVTNVNRDLEVGLKALGGGIAATGVIGSGIGLGIIFGNLLSATARNPSLSNKMFANAIMGAAFCESLGLFAITIAFVVMQ